MTVAYMITSSFKTNCFNNKPLHFQNDMMKKQLKMIFINIIIIVIQITGQISCNDYITQKYGSNHFILKHRLFLLIYSSIIPLIISIYTKNQASTWNWNTLRKPTQHQKEQGHCLTGSFKPDCDSFVLLRLTSVQVNNPKIPILT